MNAIVPVPLSAGAVHTVGVGGKPHVVFRHAVEEIGLSYPRQYRKLLDKPWATVAQKATVGSDGRSRVMDVVPVRTFLMWLATVDANRVSEAARPTLIAFQSETADAIETYWTRGVAVNQNRAAYSDEHIEAEVQRQLQKRQYKEVVRDSLKAIGTEPGWQYGEIHNVILAAITGMKAPDIIGSGRELQTWKGDKPTKADHKVATNYLFADELESFNLITDAVAVDLRHQKPKTYREFLILVRNTAERYTA